MTKSLVFGVMAVCVQLSAEKINVPLSDPNRPALVKASTVNGAITVRTHSGKVVMVESGPETAVSATPAANGMRQISGGMGGLNIEEENNVVRVGASIMSKNSDLQIWVPEKASLNLRAVNGKGIAVESVDGDIDVHIVNGPITLTNVSGAVVAHTLNGKMLVTLTRVTPNKPMSFSTLNGTVDVTLPASTKADLKIRNEWGKVFSDFDMNLRSDTNVKNESGGEGRPRYRVRIDKSVIGQINGGGPEVTFRSMNGTIYIRKGSN